LTFHFAVVQSMDSLATKGQNEAIIYKIRANLHDIPGYILVTNFVTTLLASQRPNYQKSKGEYVQRNS